jgi:hypothetical protein
MRYTAALALSVLISPLARAQDVTSPELAQVVEATRAKGLPIEPILSKVRQGVIMHAPPARIVTAAQAVAARLEIARTALEPRATPADIAAGENALAIKGVTPDALTAIRAANPRESVAVPVGVLAQLVASGIAPNRASEIVTTLVKRKASNAQLVSLGNNVNDDVTRGRSADASLNARLSALTPLLAPPGGNPIQALQAVPGGKRP